MTIPHSPKKCGRFSITRSGEKRPLSVFCVYVRVPAASPPLRFEFRTLVAESSWNEEALQGFFLSALSDDIKDQLTSWEEYAGLDELIALSIRFDNRLHERRRERGLHPVSTHSLEPTATPRPSPSSFAPPRRERGLSPEPMQIGRTHLSPEERERRMRSGSCLYLAVRLVLEEWRHWLEGADRPP